MPRLKDATMQTGTVRGLQAFKFSGTKIGELGATEYTLVTIAVDTTGSVMGFDKELRDCLITAVDSCKKSPRSMNLLVRVIFFNSALPNGIDEIHGFKPLGDIDPSSYPDIVPDGLTPLYDACFSAVGATLAYGKQLMDQDFLANGIVIVITDGGDNVSSATTTMIKKEIERGTKGEEIESLIAIAVGVNTKFCATELAKLETEAGMKYIDAGDATKSKLAKLAGFVSQSVSSQSQSLGTGGPSQNIAATI
ncbi:MAG: hypothetical protein JWN50_491 [Parcubacteria group bacterium]|nr:hypothetical protein [Parcubacteria group bacterium]